MWRLPTPDLYPRTKATYLSMVMKHVRGVSAVRRILPVPSILALVAVVLLPLGLSDLDLLLSTRTGHREGLLTRARLLVKLEQPLAAAADYDKAIAGLSNPTPEYYQERAGALTSAGPDHRARALAGVDEGIKKLGPIFTLVDFAIDIELNVDRPDRALLRLDQFRPSMPPERWLHRRGIILDRMGRTDEARKSYAQALESLHAAPPRRQSTRAAKAFETELVTLLGSADRSR